MKSIILSNETVDALTTIVENLLDDAGSILGGTYATELNDLYMELTGNKYNDATSQPMSFDMLDSEDIPGDDTNEEVS